MLVNVANPPGGFVGRAAAKIERDLRLCIDEGAEFQEFVGAERVVLGNAQELSTC